MHAKYLVALVAALALTVLAAGCGQTAQEKAANRAQRKADANAFYVPQHAMEQQNYNDRQRLGDNPSTILWCTFYPPTVGQEPITVPIAGKLTSSGKRPFADDTGLGPDGMYGSSVEYRYGFDPTRAIYYDFAGMASICTNAPLVYQLNKTVIATQTATTLTSLDKAAEAALKAGDAKKAAAILHQAEKGTAK
jgi:hypothetical protein